MSNVIMRIVGVKVNGAASIGGALAAKSLTKDNLLAANEWFTVDSISWSAAKKGSGLSSLAPITVTRKLDGASEKLLALLFKPGDKGVKVELAFTKEASTGEGMVKFFEIRLDKVMISDYAIEAEEDGVPTETFSLSYTEITENYSVDNADKMENTGDVTFDVGTSTLTSGIADAL